MGIDHSTLTSFFEPTESEKLYDAATYGDIEDVMECISNGANINYERFNGDSVMATSIRQHNRDIVDYLLDIGVDVVVNGHQFLELAVDNGDADLVKVLLDKGSKPGSLLLYSAIKYCGKQNMPVTRDAYFKIIRLLVRYGQNLDDYIINDKSMIRYVEHCQYVFNANSFTVNDKLKTGCTVLHHAVELDMADEVEQLLIMGADPTIRDCNHRSSFNIAYERNFYHMIDLFKRYGFDDILMYGNINVDSIEL